MTFDKGQDLQLEDACFIAFEPGLNHAAHGNN
jgi:hypothetical protein